MPNWCHNVLSVDGEPKFIKEFIKLIGEKKPYLDFNRFIEYPAEYRTMDEAFSKWFVEQIEKGGYIEWKKAPKDGFSSGGYEWCIANWGTKWNVYENCNWLYIFDEKVALLFETAWTPPEPVVIEMSKQFPELKFILEYDEPDNGFSGLLVVENGFIKDLQYNEH